MKAKILIFGLIGLAIALYLIFKNLVTEGARTRATGTWLTQPQEDKANRIETNNTRGSLVSPPAMTPVNNGNFSPSGMLNSLDLSLKPGQMIYY
jgi:hypothetical protein